ncbi:MAG: GMC family oxidoreductase [Thermoanaerobaculia bacterium]|nr:GMC family oxidoreductase [Thermoanaerobaculia bacterium]
MGRRPVRRLTASVLTRRRFLTGSAALGLGAGLAGCRFRPEFDVCVIGSGFAGTYLALELVQHGIETALVEAGEGLASTFQAASTGEIDYPVQASRRIGLGGTSGLWTGVVTRLFPDDFRLHSEYGLHVDWPLDYPELEPYYCRSESLLSAIGYPSPNRPPKHCEYPWALDPPPPAPELRHRSGDGTGEELSFFPLTFSRRDPDRPNPPPLRLVDREIPELTADRHATLLTGRRAVALHAMGRQVERLETLDADGRHDEITARIFVVAAGVFESASLLLRSQSSRFPDGLGDGAATLGHHFNHHPHFHRQLALPEGRAVRGFYRTHDLDPLLRSEGLNACNFQLTQSGGGQLGISPELDPASSHRVMLSERHDDPLGLPSLEVQAAYTERDRRTIDRCLAIGNDLAAQLGDTSGPAFHQRFHSHPAGTCRMARDASSGVVDAHGKVFGVDNVYVAGASTFPTSGATNPTNTVVALALRLADHLIESLT